VYPRLAPVAMDLVSAPASEAYCERVFSVCGELCNGKMNRLSVNLETSIHEVEHGTTQCHMAVF
jgi:hAT family C-terminal dimerisation region